MFTKHTSLINDLCPPTLVEKPQTLVRRILFRILVDSSTKLDNLPSRDRPLNRSASGITRLERLSLSQLCMTCAMLHAHATCYMHMPHVPTQCPAHCTNENSSKVQHCLNRSECKVWIRGCAYLLLTHNTTKLSPRGTLSLHHRQLFKKWQYLYGVPVKSITHGRQKSSDGHWQIERLKIF